MENQPKLLKKSIMLNYGLYLGITSILISVIIYALGMHYDQDWKIGTISIAVMAIIIFLGIKKFKELNNDLLSLGQALKTGIGIALIGGIISVVYTLIFMNFIEPDFMANTMVKAEQEMIDKFPDLSDEQIESQIEMMKNFSSPTITSAFALIASIFLGFVISLIVGFILKKSDEEITSI